MDDKGVLGQPELPEKPTLVIDGGRQFTTGEVGRIDLLARDTVTRDWVVIELKRGPAADETVAQIRRAGKRFRIQTSMETVRLE